MTYEEYTDLLQNHVQIYLDKGVNPWQMPWQTAHNGATGRHYTGMNALLLNLISDIRYDGEPRWFTYEQAKSKGYPVKKGEKSAPAFFFSNSYYRVKKDKDGNSITDEQGRTVKEIVKTRPVFRVYPVFNAKQLACVPPYIAAQKTTSGDIDLAERIIKESPVPIFFDQQSKAYYTPVTDDIHIPTKEKFVSEAEYYSTLWHEMTHSTGSEFRLNRSTMQNYFADHAAHCKEELIAEIGAVALCEKCEMRYAHANSAAYIDYWASSLRDGDFKLIDLYADVSPAVRFLTEKNDRTTQIEHAKSRTQEKKRGFSRPR